MCQIQTYCGMSAENQQRQSLLWNGFANTPVASQWFSSRHVIAATDTQSTIEELLETMFPVRSVPRTGCHYQSAERVLRRQSEEWEVGVRWPAAFEEVSP
jgi:hypothetical protein